MSPGAELDLVSGGAPLVLAEQFEVGYVDDGRQRLPLTEVWFRHAAITSQARGLRTNPLADHGDHCYFSGGRARDRGGGTRERIDMGAPLRGHGRTIGRPGAPFTSTPERHDRAIHF